MTDFSEEPSDGFKIGVAILGVVRATENPLSKILRISKSFSNYKKAMYLKISASQTPSAQS